MTSVPSNQMSISLSYCGANSQKPEEWRVSHINIDIVGIGRVMASVDPRLTAENLQQLTFQAKGLSCTINDKRLSCSAKQVETMRLSLTLCKSSTHPHPRYKGDLINVVPVPINFSLLQGEQHVDLHLSYLPKSTEQVLATFKATSTNVLRSR